MFWSVCIPLRSAISAYAMSGDRRVLRVAASVISVRWLAGLEVGDEGFFGGPAWWADERPMHGFFWGMYALSGNGRYLAVDTAFGAANWVRTKSSIGKLAE